MKAVTVVLSRQERVWLEQIIMDRDRDEALRFAEALRKRVEQQEKSHMKPAL